MKIVGIKRGSIAWWIGVLASASLVLAIIVQMISALIILA